MQTEKPSETCAKNSSDSAAAALHDLPVLGLAGGLCHAGEPRVRDGARLDGAHDRQVLLQLHLAVVVGVDLAQDAKTDLYVSSKGSKKSQVRQCLGVQLISRPMRTENQL